MHKHLELVVSLGHGLPRVRRTLVGVVDRLLGIGDRLLGISLHRLQQVLVPLRGAVHLELPLHLQLVLVATQLHRLPLLLALHLVAEHVLVDDAGLHLLFGRLHSRRLAACRPLDLGAHAAELGLQRLLLTLLVLAPAQEPRRLAPQPQHLRGWGGLLAAHRRRNHAERVGVQPLHQARRAEPRVGAHGEGKQRCGGRHLYLLPRAVWRRLAPAASDPEGPLRGLFLEALKLRAPPRRARRVAAALLLPRVVKSLARHVCVLLARALAAVEKRLGLVGLEVREVRQAIKVHVVLGSQQPPRQDHAPVLCARRLCRGVCRQAEKLVHVRIGETSRWVYCLDNLGLDHF